MNGRCKVACTLLVSRVRVDMRCEAMRLWMFNLVVWKAHCSFICLLCLCEYML